MDIIQTRIGQSVIMATPDLTDAAFPTVSATVTDPLAVNGTIRTEGFNHGSFIFFGTGADNATAALKLFAWYQTEDGLWIPQPLFGASSVSLGTKVGVGGKRLSDSHRLVNLITPYDPYFNDPAIRVYSQQDVTPALEELPAMCALDLNGALRLQLTVDLGTATAFNAYARLY